MGPNTCGGFRKSLTPTATTMPWAALFRSNIGCIKECAMKNRFLHCIVVTVAVFFAAYAMASDVNAQAPPKPAPHLADGRPDLNGTWDHGGGISFVRPQTLPDGSVCVLGCPPAATAAPPTDGNNPPAGARGGRGGAAAAPAAPNFPKYKPEFLTKVKDLSDRQVQ